MRIKFIKRWRSFKADRLADIADGAANILISRGIAAAFPLPPNVEPVAGIDIDVDAKVPPGMTVARDYETPRQKRKAKSKE